MRDKKGESNLKRKATIKIERIYQRMASKDPKKTIHKTALASAAVVAGLPIGVDAWALRLCEVYMLMSIYGYYGIKLSKATAESLLTAAFAQMAGETLAYAALEAADAAAVLSGGTALVICIPIAAGLIETVGWTTIRYIEGSGVAEVALRTMEIAGGIADASRIAKAVAGAAANCGEVGPGSTHGAKLLSFGSSNYTEKDLEDATSKYEVALGKLKARKEYLANDISAGRDTTLSANDVKYATIAVEAAESEVKRIANALGITVNLPG